MKHVRIKDNTAIEVITFNPAGLFHPTIKWVQVPDHVEAGWTTDGENWTAPPEPEVIEPTPVEPDPVILSVIEFKMCFTSSERLSIYALRDAGDAIIADWLSILDDPRCTEVDLGLASTREAVNYLVGKVEGFTLDRAAAVINGTII